MPHRARVLRIRRLTRGTLPSVAIRPLVTVSNAFTLSLYHHLVQLGGNPWQGQAMVPECYFLLCSTAMIDSPSHPRLIIELGVALALEPWHVQGEVPVYCLQLWAL